MITRMQGLKRKLEALHSEEKAVMLQSNKRIAHLQDLYTIPSLVDETYDLWSRVRLDRLLADALLRNGFGESARMLAREKGIEGLVDVDVFVQCAKIEASLRHGSTTECLAWCVENKNTLRKNKVASIFVSLSSSFSPKLKCLLFQQHRAPWNSSSVSNSISNWCAQALSGKLLRTPESISLRTVKGTYPTLNGQLPSSRTPPILSETLTTSFILPTDGTNWQIPSSTRTILYTPYPQRLFSALPSRLACPA